jgi:fumarate reductase flavoprotein subunit
MKQISTDVAIISAGAAGLAAAVAAAESGARVAVFEKAAIAGGTANMGMGPFGVESRIQKKSMVNLTKEEAFRKFMDYTHWMVDARLVHDYFWKSGDTINWLEDMGVEFSGVVKYYPESEATWHVVKPEGGGAPGPRAAAGMTKAMQERAVELGVDFYFNTPVKSIRKEGASVVGVNAVGKDGEEYFVTSKAVIVATGGFGNNQDMIKEMCGFTWGADIASFRIPGIDGDGLKMAWEAGAGKGNMDMERIIGCLIPMDGAYLLPILFWQPHLVVNLDGERIMNEEIIENGAVMANIIQRQRGRCVFSVIDDSILKIYRREGMDFPSGVMQGDPTANFEEQIAEIKKLYPDAVYLADSPGELADQVGMDPDNFVRTLGDYNHSCDLHYDDLFCKPRKYLRPLRGKKLYALRLLTGAYGSLGGIKINYKLEVLTDACEIIPGLYGAGTDVCDIYAGTYLYYLPGNTMGFAINTGRMSGEYAAKYALAL